MERHKQGLTEKARDYSAFEFGTEREETIVSRSGVSRNYVHLEYRFQPGPGDCVYDVLDHVFRSNYRPINYAFIITAGACEDQLAPYGKQRSDILASFEEIQ